MIFTVNLKICILDLLFFASRRGAEQSDSGAKHAAPNLT